MECDGVESFSEVARDHATHPRNYGPLANAEGHARVTGPCGDTMEFWLTARDGKVVEVTFTTDGCGSSRACGSMTTCLAEGRDIEEVMDLPQKDVLDALREFPAEFAHCALLAVTTLRAACDDYWQHGSNRCTEAGDARTTCSTCGDESCSASNRKSDESDEELEDRRRLESRLCRIRHKVVVLSGKGGVGKSTVAVNLATALMMSGKRVGLLDIDIHGPSIPTMLGLEREQLRGSADGLLPFDLSGMKVMSLGFLLESPDNAVIWRGPMKMGVIKQFLRDVVWGDLDYLIIDSPPGTGDEPLSICQLIGSMDGAVIVTTPQKVAAVDVRKCITFCRQLQVPVLGVVENMSGFVCPKCGEITQIFPSGAGRGIAEDMNVPFLGSIPIDPQIAEAGDSGHAFVDRFAASSTAVNVRKIIDRIVPPDDPNTRAKNT